MPATRSSTRNATAAVMTPAAEATVQDKVAVAKTTRKRKTASSTASVPAKKARATRTAAPDTVETEAATVPKLPTVTLEPVTAADGEELVPAVLTFSFEDAKQHLTSVDPRFEEVFRRVKCKPFEHLERVDPFRTLAHSILGQQISWKAAAAITHKFIRLFDPSIPESMAECKSDFFPSAHHVASKDLATLRTAGLSGRKAEYISDLATRFADGRLSTKKLLEADDEELYRILTEVRGIGAWTVNIFAMFSLRRPDILPVGDLGVQRGMLRWFLSLHQPSYPISLRRDKLIDQAADEPSAESSQQESSQARAATPDMSSVPPVTEVIPPSTPKKKGKSKATNGGKAETGLALPTPFTPSINKTLNMFGKQDEDETLAQIAVPPLPEGLTIAQMKTRLTGKNKIKGALLTPKEMEALTESWRPYRSLGAYYMWALAEDPKN